MKLILVKKINATKTLTVTKILPYRSLFYYYTAKKYSTKELETSSTSEFFHLCCSCNEFHVQQDTKLSDISLLINF